MSTTYKCACSGCEEIVDAALALDYLCDYCFAHCVADDWLWTPEESEDGRRMAKSLTGLAHWKTHNTRNLILDRGLDLMEWARRIHRGERPPTVLQLFDGDDPDAAYCRLMFRLRCEDEEPL